MTKANVNEQQETNTTISKGYHRNDKLIDKNNTWEQIIIEKTIMNYKRLKLVNKIQFTTQMTFFLFKDTT